MFSVSLRGLYWPSCLLEQDLTPASKTKGVLFSRYLVTPTRAYEFESARIIGPFVSPATFCPLFILKWKAA